MIYVYLRVSTDAQDVENQRLGISQWLEKNALTADAVSEDTASGSADWNSRELGQIVNSLQKGDILLCSEISRLARSTLQVLEIMKAVTERGASVVVVKNGLTIDGSMQAKIISTVLGLAAEIEREFIRARTSEALARRKAQGLPLGRPVGATSPSKLDKKENEIKTYIKKGLSVTAIAKLVDCQRATLYSWAEKKGLQLKTD